MTARCAQCGEAILGLVNRCWKCGKEFSSRHGDLTQPPIRRPPIVLRSHGGSESKCVIAELANGDDAEKEMRKGSPFADSVSLTSLAGASTAITVLGNRRDGARPWGTVGSVVLSVMGLILVFRLPVGGLIVSFVSTLFALWAFEHRRFKISVAVLILAAIGILLNLAGIGVEIYVYFLGVKPWQNPTPSF